MITKPYEYKLLEKVTINGTRYYHTPDKVALPSVTTILDKTADKKALVEWRKRVGDQEATRITKEAGGRGTTMHKYIERWLLNEEKEPGTNLVHQQAFKMSRIIIEGALKPNLKEAWGTELSLYYPELYAGTTDLVGIWDKDSAIIDFKQSNKPKKREWIEGYFCQLCAYAVAHNEMYGTDINQGVVLVCTPELKLQIFEIKGKEFDHWTSEWWKKVDKYYKEHH